ncbi:hypothetical protein [Rhodopirellula sp. P2]|uniref:hypothetical protein n=1 Tax=Rhodopirellula sp. P2 TaxID=2127060 RepID=UPI0023687725|nr:hypothetical protein [Rhodopirellula sp. P2]WDQ15719.1 hypothetical protein PSR62_19005 [Rhodopirellula sp. P2]
MQRNKNVVLNSSFLTEITRNAETSNQKDSTAAKRSTIKIGSLPGKKIGIHSAQQITKMGQSGDQTTIFLSARDAAKLVAELTNHLAKFLPDE